MKFVVVFCAILLAVALAEETPRPNKVCNAMACIPITSCRGGDAPVVPDDGCCAVCQGNATDGDDGHNTEISGSPNEDVDDAFPTNTTTSSDDDGQNDGEGDDIPKVCSAVRCRMPSCPIGEELFKQANACCYSCQPRTVTVNPCRVTCLLPNCPQSTTMFKPDNACCSGCRRFDDDSTDDDQFPNATLGVASAEVSIDSGAGRNCTSCATAGSDTKLQLKLVFKKGSFDSVSSVLKGDWQNVLSLAYGACRAHVRVLTVTPDVTTSSLALTYAVFDNLCDALDTPLPISTRIDTSAYTEDAPSLAESKIVLGATTSGASITYVSALVLFAVAALLF